MTSSFPFVHFRNSLNLSSSVPHLSLPVITVQNWVRLDFLREAERQWNLAEGSLATSSILRIVTYCGATFNLTGNENPLYLHPRLAIVPHYQQDRTNVPHSSFLEIVPATADNEPGKPKLSLCLPVCDKEDNLLSFARIKTYACDDSRRLVEKVVEALIQAHSKESTATRTEAGQEFQFVLCQSDGCEVDTSSMPPKKLLSRLLSGKVYARLTCPLRLFKSLKRPYKISELIQMSSTFVEVFQILENESFFNFLLQLSTMNSTLLTSCIEAGRKLREKHRYLVTVFQSEPNDFFFPIGQILSSNFDELGDLYLEYHDKYREVREKMKIAEAKMGSKWINYIQKFQKTFQTDLSDILLRPIQQLPRYRLLLAGLCDETPVRHFDYRSDQRCLRRIEKLQDQANHILASVQTDLAISRDPPPNSRFLDQFEMQCDRRKYRLLLFDRLLWLLQRTNDTWSFKTEWSYLDVTIVELCERSITCWENPAGGLADSMSYSFKTVTDRNDMITQYRHQLRQNSPQDAFQPVHWTILSAIDSRAYHSMVIIPNGSDFVELIIFGGLNESSEPVNDTLKVKILSNGDCERSKHGFTTCPSPRYHAAMAWTPNGIFLYGGTDNGQNKFKDFWKFEEDQWKELEINGDVPPPGFAFDLAYFPKDTLLLTGAGVTETVFYTYSISTSVWTKIVQPRNLRLPPWVGHKIFPIGEASGLLVGGHTSSSWCMDAVIYFTDWGRGGMLFIRCQGLFPIRRLWGSFALLANHVFVIGGERESEGYTLDLETKQWHFCRDIGDAPDVYGAACVTLGNRVFIHGGFGDSAIIQAGLYQGQLEGIKLVRSFDPKTFEMDDWYDEVVMRTDVPQDETWVERAKANSTHQKTSNPSRGGSVKAVKK